MESPDHIEARIRNIEDALGIASVTGAATLSLTHALPVGTVFITKTETNPLYFGTWTLLASGNLLGGQVGTVYAWRRTA